MHAHRQERRATPGAGSKQNFAMTPLVLPKQAHHKIFVVLFFDD
jgi:hypothetical protein